MDVDLDEQIDAPASNMEPRKLAGLAAIIAGLVVLVLPSSPLWLVLAGLSVVFALGVPLLLSSSPMAAKMALPLAVAAVAVLGAWAPYARATGGGEERDRTHDGGVIVTREAARLTVRGENPYTARYDDVLPPSWAQVQGVDGDLVANPVIDHAPYLPASFLIQVPFDEASGLLGIEWDPRVLGWLALVGTSVALAVRPGPAWARVGAVATLANAYTFTYLAWGTNDSLAVCAFVLALVLADGLAGSRPRPGWAGVALAVAISCKFLFLVTLAPLAVIVGVAGGWVALRRWWTLPATLALTCLPFLAWSPSAFLDDVLWFNLGRTEPLMPTSGLGLPAVAGDLFTGPLLGVTTVLGFAIAFGAVPWLAARRRSLAWVGPLTSLALLAILIPARTFQTNYLVLVVAAAASAWWLVSDVVAPSTGRQDRG